MEALDGEKSEMKGLEAERLKVKESEVKEVEDEQMDVAEFEVLVGMGESEVGKLEVVELTVGSERVGIGKRGAFKLEVKELGAKLFEEWKVEEAGELEVLSLEELLDGLIWE